MSKLRNWKVKVFEGVATWRLKSPSIRKEAWEKRKAISQWLKSLKKKAGINQLDVKDNMLGAGETKSKHEIIRTYILG